MNQNHTSLGTTLYSLIFSTWFPKHVPSELWSRVAGWSRSTRALKSIPLAQLGQEKDNSQQSVIH